LVFHCFSWHRPQKTTGFAGFCRFSHLLETQGEHQHHKDHEPGKLISYVEALGQQQAEAAGNSNILRHPAAPHYPPRYSHVKPPAKDKRTQPEFPAMTWMCRPQCQRPNLLLLAVDVSVLLNRCGSLKMHTEVRRFWNRRLCALSRAKMSVANGTTVDISSLPEPAIRLEDTAQCGSYQTLEFAILERSFWIGQERALTKDNLKHLKHSLQSGVSFCSERTHRVSASNRNGTETSESAVISMEWPSGR